MQWSKEMDNNLHTALYDAETSSQNIAFRKWLPKLTFHAIRKRMKELNLKCPDEIRFIRLSRTQKGKHVSEEARRRIGLANRKFGNQNPFYGKKHSLETKQKISQARIKKYEPVRIEKEKVKMAKDTAKQLQKANKRIALKMGSIEFSEACRNRMLGTHHTKEAKQKISDNNRRRLISDVTRDKHRVKIQKQMDGRGWFGKIYKLTTRFGEFTLRSGYEVIALRKLEEDINIKSVTYEKVKTAYVDENGRKRMTYSDFMINDVKIIEVKSKYYVLNVPRTQLKIAAMKKYCGENNLQYELWTEDELGLVKTDGRINIKKYLEERKLCA